MDQTESDVHNYESPTVDTNGFLKPRNGHTIGSVVDVKIEDFDGEQSSGWHKQPQPYRIPQRRGKRKAESLLGIFCQWIVEHQIGKLTIHCT